MAPPVEATGLCRPRADFHLVPSNSIAMRKFIIDCSGFNDEADFWRGGNFYRALQKIALESRTILIRMD